MMYDLANMEVSIVRDQSIKIKNKTSSVVVDPVSKTDANVVILTKNAGRESLDNIPEKAVVIDGAGEYEVGGISMIVTDMNGELTYSFDSEGTRILLLAESTLAKIKAEDEYNAIVVRVDEEVKDTVLANLTAQVFIFYGDLEKVKLQSENIQKLSKVNLRKKDDLVGSFVLLS